MLNLAWVDDTMYFDPKMEVFPEPIGFIGNDYQRFYIHFSSVIKNKKNPYQYDVRGKTKVKNTRHAFKGTITIYSEGMSAVITSFTKIQTRQEADVWKGTQDPTGAFIIIA